jgi:hypothetical protein
MRGGGEILNNLGLVSKDEDVFNRRATKIFVTPYCKIIAADYHAFHGTTTE